MGGLHVISVLKYGREATGLPANPSAPATVGMTRVMKPVTGVESASLQPKRLRCAMSAST